MRYVSVQNIFLIGVIIFIFLLAFFLRAQEILSHNFLFLIDQGRDMMAVKGIVFDHKLTLIGPYTSLGGVFQGPLYYYLLAIPTFIFAGDPWGAVLLMVCISLLTVIVAPIWIYKRFGKAAGIVTLILFSFAPQSIAAATFSWNPHPMWLLITIFILSFYEVNKGRLKMSFLMWPVVTLMFHFEMALGIYFFIASILYFLLFNRKIIFTKFFLGGFFVSLVFLLPQIIFDVRHEFLMTKSVFTMISGKNESLWVKGEDLGVINLLRDHIAVHVEVFRGAFISNGIFSSLPQTLILLSVLSYFILLKSKGDDGKKRQFISIVFPLFFLMVILTMLYPFLLRSWFLTGFESFYLLFVAVLLSVLWRGVFGKLLLIILFISLSIYSIGRIKEIYEANDYGGVAKIKGKQDAISYIFKDGGKNPYGILIFTPPVNTDAFDYLIWWESYKTDREIPHKEKKGLVYLLMEPDPYKPWSHKGWLETVIKTGEVLETKTLPSGYIIQKRQF